MNEQKLQMKHALKIFGNEHKFEIDVVEKTINDDEIIQNLIDLFNNKWHDYPDFHYDYFKTESHNMYDFLEYVDDVDNFGICENFAQYQIELHYDDDDEILKRNGLK